MIFIGAGRDVAPFGSLDSKNPRTPLRCALLTPFWTFYCIISLVNGD